MRLPAEEPVKAGYAEVGETVLIQAPPDHDLRGDMEFTYWSDGSFSIEFNFDGIDARIDRMEIDHRTMQLQIAPKWS